MSLRYLLAWAVVAWSLLGHHVTGGRGTDGLPAVLPWVVLLGVLLSDGAAVRRVLRLVGVEALKARRTVLLRTGLATTIAVTLLAALLREPPPGASGWSVAAVSLSTGLWVAEVFLLVLGATAIAGEASGGTLKMMLPHAYRRADWVVAKAIVLVGASVLFALVLSATALGHAAATRGLGDVMRELEPLFGETTAGLQTFEPGAAPLMARHVAAALGVGLATLVVTGLLGLALSALFDSVVAALSLAFLLLAGLKFADVLLRLSQDSLQRIYAWYPDRLLELVDKLGRAINERWDEALVGAGLSVALATGAVLLLLAVRFLARRDVHA